MSENIIDARQLSMLEIVKWCRLQMDSGTFSWALRAVHPDLNPSSYDGERVSQGLHRHLGTWISLAESLECRLSCPVVLEDDKESVLFRFSKRPDASFHSDRGSCEEKYGVEAEYHRITKQEDPFWLQYYQRSLLDCRLKSGSRILFLGINDGDELEPFRHWFPEVEAEFEYVGLDLAESALAKAKERFPERNVVMHQWDISSVKPDIGMFDCMVCIATLQSSNFEGKRVFRSWFQSCLKPDGSVILGLPNGRYHDGKLILGAAVKHYRLPEMGLLIKDLDYFKRYLQSKKKRVTVQGRGTVFLTATSLAKP